MYAYAAGHTAAASSLLAKIQSAILFPLMSLMVGVALLVFLWGGFQYVVHADEDSGREEGKKHMLFGIIGLLVMLSAYAILKIAALTFGVQVP